MAIQIPPTFVADFHDENVLSQLEYTQLGNTDMMVSKLSYGASPLGSVFRETKESESLGVVNSVVKNGINLIDTSPWYGHGKSETVLGKILPDLPRKSYYLNTKVGRYLPDVNEMFDFRAERVIRSVDESLQRMNVSYVDVIQVHDAEFSPSIELILNETLPALQKVKDSGKAKYIGITGYPLSLLKKIIEKSPVKIDTVLTYCHGSMNDNSLQDYLPFFQSKGVGVINASPLSMGLLSERGPPTWHPASQNVKETCIQASQYCKSQSVDISKLATHFSLQQPGVPTTLIGTASLDNITKNMNTLKHGINEKEQTVSDYILDRILQPLNNENWEGVEIEKFKREKEMGTIS